MDLQLLNYNLIAWPPQGDTQGVFMVRGDIQNKAKKANTVQIAAHTGRESTSCENKDVMVRYGCHKCSYSQKL